MDTVKDIIICSAYRYAIGRSSYVISLATDIPVRYYEEFSDNRKKFIAKDIRKILFDKINKQICNLTIHRPDSTYDFNPVSTFLEFIKREQIESEEELNKYDDLEYFAEKDKYNYSKLSESNRSVDVMSINDLIPWETFASCFDIDKYKYFKGKAYFRTWGRKFKKNEMYDMYVYDNFGWEPKWVNLESFLSNKYTIIYDEKTFFNKIENEK